MNNIKLYALGGLGENGKNMYCVEINNEILVLDAGFKYPDETMYGIDFVVADFAYLQERSKDIKGLFLSHGHMDNIGAVDGFIRYFPHVPVYGSSTTLFMLEYLLKEAGIKDAKLIEVERFENIKFKDYSVFAFPLTHSIPNNFAYSINTKQGIIFYSSDYIFDQSADDINGTDIGKLAYLGKQGVLCLLSESLQVAKSGHTSPEHRISAILEDFFEGARQKAFVMVYSSNISKIQEILDESGAARRKVVIYGKRLTDIVNRGIEVGIIKFNSENLISIFDVEKHADEEITVLVSGERDRPFSGMKRIVSGKDKYLKLTSNDSVLIAASPVPNTEIEASEVTNDIYRSGANVTIVSKKEVRGNHASKEDLLLLLNLLQPKYYIPIKGEYRHQIAGRDAALSRGFKSENIIMLENGQVVNFENGEYSIKEKIKTGDLLIDGDKIAEGDIVLKDRELLKENGIVIVSCAVNIKNKQIIAGPEIVSRGFIYIKENKDYIEELKEECRNLLQVGLDSNFAYNEIQKHLRDGISKYIYNDKGRRPMILIMIQTI